MKGVGPTRAAVGHMPFPGHRTQAEVIIDRFFDALSDHGDVTRAASAVGRTAEWGQEQLAAVAKAMGKRAA